MQTEKQRLRRGFIVSAAGICHEDACLDIFDADILDVFFQQSLGFLSKRCSLCLDCGILMKSLRHIVNQQIINEKIEECTHLADNARMPQRT